ncbi:hypothetical protein COEREDRAFT_83540 [Coemansia reversa NRRL 1564]|uniref:BHLH domain-containing protein n=1 Tax=Coemansia reversa (strain ATCC 12441 / NRRL 1564) TaxID=763665 RepID=A0A2G5B2V5_COERN|nr:hypothetical protein COEREDRAFT_83540 [Coemansia reversa NRRL 1564]|eukprot:PIA13359.1 hypothetical protein COEREDRAFT_83540 [Coemansia reversa NRRL 1564]
MTQQSTGSEPPGSKQTINAAVTRQLQELRTTSASDLSFAAEVAKLLTPFMSPADTALRQPTVSMAFSPLTSPALAPHVTTARNQGSGMPPPSSSITAEHIMRRQQQQQPIDKFGPQLSTGLSHASSGSRSRRGTTGASPHHHPYRIQQSSKRQFADSQQTQHKRPDHIFSPTFSSLPEIPADVAAGNSINADDFLLDTLSVQNSSKAAAEAAAAAIIASIHNTPVLHVSTGSTTPAMSAVATELSGLHLPDSIVQSTAFSHNTTQNAQNGRTLHQLNISPHMAATHSGNDGHTVANADMPFASFQNSELLSSRQITEQMSAWLDQTVGATGIPHTESTPTMATPALLMNLPESAHHLPHSVSGNSAVTDRKNTDYSKQLLSFTGFEQPTSTATLVSNTTNTTPLLQFLTQSAPVSEFVHPPAPPPLLIGPSSIEPSDKQTNTDIGKTNSGAVTEPSSPNKSKSRRKSVSTATTTATQARPTGNTRTRRGDNSSTRRRSRISILSSPQSTPLVPSILRDVSTAGGSPKISPYNGPQKYQGSTPLTPAIAPRPIKAQPTNSQTTTPLLRARPTVAATSTTNIVNLESDVVARLATKSNYQNILDGNSEILGLTYRTEFKSGLERRRKNHKNAEQKRRDSLKVCFQDLHERLPEVDPKLVSKIYLLKKATSYIDQLHRVNEALMNAAKSGGMDVDAIVRNAVEEERIYQQQINKDELDDVGSDNEVEEFDNNRLLDPNEMNLDK